MTATQAAQQMGVCVETVVRMAHRGQLRGRKVGRRWRFTAEDLETLISLPAPRPAPLPVVEPDVTPVPAAAASTAPARPRRRGTARERIKALDPYADLRAA